MNQQGNPHGYPPPPPHGEQPSQGLAIASLVLGLLGFGVLGIIFAAVAKKNGNTSGIATAGLVISIVFTALYAGIFACVGCVTCAALPFI